MGLFNQIKPLPMFRRNIYWIFVTIAVSITACSSNDSSKVQVVDKSRSYKSNVKTSTIPQTGKVVQTNTSTAKTASYAPVTSGQHVVQQGETLYSLAFNYGRDWKDLAQANNIGSPFTIYPGQTIYLSGGAVPQAITTSTQTTKNETHNTGSIKVTKTEQTTKPVTTAAPPVTNAPKPTQAVVGGWTWPTMGTVIGTYSPSGTVNKGIDIAGNEGDAIVSASNGTVVYAGNNLHGYGELLIIKHNDSYVSAYAHNRKLLVTEGQKVTAGQKIAEMGSTGADRVKLHFEIRQNGKPVDPVKYLPKH